MSQYRWIILDADGTLFDYDRAETYALEATFDQSELRWGPAVLPAYRAINDALWAGFERGEVDQATIKVSRFRTLFEQLGLPADPVAFSRRYEANLARGAFLIDGALELVRALAAHFSLMILTNGLTDVQRPRFGASPIHAYIREVVISEEVGHSKPRPGIFDVALARMGGPALAEVLMVGDSLTSDMRGAYDYGLDRCWYNPAGRPNESGIPLTFEIGALDELPRLLGIA